MNDTIKSEALTTQLADTSWEIAKNEHLYDIVDMIEFEERAVNRWREDYHIEEMALEHENKMLRFRARLVTFETNYKKAYMDSINRGESDTLATLRAELTICGNNKKWVKHNLYAIRFLIIVEDAIKHFVDTNTVPQHQSDIRPVFIALGSGIEGLTFTRAMENEVLKRARSIINKEVEQ